MTLCTNLYRISLDQGKSLANLGNKEVEEWEQMMTVRGG